MKPYLMSVCYPAGSTQPSPEALKKIMHDVNAVHEELKAANSWVFGAGLHPPSTATVVRPKLASLRSDEFASPRSSSE